ncbi:MAG: sugar kinase [Bacteroidetes bacterium GWF2_38_335]|nr:MAG: sugar kinase [Bacteroidetes bacterium GWF2_38_335]OFY80354.1 MAG: sugar kinase [Bacteroidetes bacterium RIFOXYA12_FULL_38_20]HBS88844.1 adenosine kinase [Bacteroidales bacterium]
MNKVLGLGNALVDIMTILDSDIFLENQKLPKGSMQLVDLHTSGAVLEAASKLKKTLSSGGSAANTIHGFASLGGKAGYIGTIGRDEYGNFFKTDMQQHGIEPRMFETDTPTGRAIALISPDSERTFATCLGAATELNPALLTDELFTGYHFLHTEGYLAFNNELLLTALKKAKKNKLKISLDMASYNVVEANLEFLKMLISNYVDIVFANEEEAKALTGKDPEAALHEISDLCEIAVVKTGARGSLVKTGDTIFEIPAIKANSIDTTGAGDLYASGFLFGLSENMPLDKCGRIGSLCAGKVIEIIGAKMAEKTWESIRENVSKM